MVVLAGDTHGTTGSGDSGPLEVHYQRQKREVCGLLGETKHFRHPLDLRNSQLRSTDLERSPIVDSNDSAE